MTRENARHLEIPRARFVVALVAGLLASTSWVPASEARPLSHEDRVAAPQANELVCDGSVDDAAPPGAVTSDTIDGDGQTITWTPLAEARTYDVVYGDLGPLRSSGGDFAAATRGCAAFQTSATSASLAATAPNVGEAFWFLVRGSNCAGNGTYDGEEGQVGSRDAEIDASPLSCHPSVCGDGVCGGSESCSQCPSDCGVCSCTSDAECQPASCCNATSCITIWEPQSCDVSTCGDGCWICLSSCSCQNGQCIALF